MINTTKAKTTKLTLGEQWNQIVERIGRHWYGELSIFDALTHCVVIAVLPVTASIPIGIVVGLLNGYGARAATAVFHIGFGLTLAALAWWCKGMFSLSNQLLSAQRMLQGLIAFLLPIWATCELLVPLSLGFASSVESDIVQPYRLALQAEKKERPPVNVLALPERHRIFVSNEIGWGSARKLAEAINANPDIRLVELESRGGLVHEANLMVDLIEKNELDTLVRGRCASACTEVFLAGRQRFVGPDARFGFHQSGFMGRERNTEWSTPEYESSIFYRAKGVAQGFSDIALNTSYYSIWSPHVIDVKRAGFATHWWSDRPKEYD
jgi:hypothetical protein